MVAQTNSPTPVPDPPLARTYGARTLTVAMLAASLLGGGGGWLVARTLPGPAHEHRATEPHEQWQCPMHPSIVQDHPGECPICGMKLVKVEARAEAAKGAAAPAQGARWQCPMHPSVVQDHPGSCPICGMKLVKTEGTPGAAPEGAPQVEGLATVSIDPARQQIIGLRTADVTRGPVGGEWRTVGRVSKDETRERHINVKVGGFVEKIHVDFVGKEVRRGEPLFALYSPELYAAQQEYLLALQTRKSLAGAGGLAGDGEALVGAARRKLQLWDVPEPEIERIEKTGEPLKTLTFRSPITGIVTKKDVVEGMRLEAGAMPYELLDLSEVWVLADVYESELRNVKLGMKASLTLRAYPNRTFSGHVSFVDPVLDPTTRTVKVRLAFPNRGGELKPEMFGEVVLHGQAREGLRIPADAVIDSGQEKFVFASLGGGKFEPRAVRTGESDRSIVEVVSGLREGEKVVTRANFLVDSESRLRASLAALSSQGSARVSAPAEGGEAKAADPHAGHRR